MALAELDVEHQKVARVYYEALHNLVRAKAF